LTRQSRVSRDELLAKQRHFLRQVVHSAATSVPFYRELFERAQVKPAHVGAPADLALLPITTREQIQAEEPTRLLHQGARESELSATRTSGSSGIPLVIRHSHEENLIHAHFKRRTLLEVGLVPRGVLATVILNPEGQQHRSPGASFERVIVDCRQDRDKILTQLVELSPTTLGGYPGTLSHLAESERSDLLERIRPELAILGGEVVTDTIRKAVAEAFQTRVTSTYASNEFRWIAGECRETGSLHVVDDSVVVEIVDESGRPVAEGEAGEVVVTGLHSFAQPFIRYRLGDVATQGRNWTRTEGCECGAPYSTLRQVRGRQIEYLTLPSGQKVSSYVLTLRLLDAAPFIQRYQVIQESPEQIRMLVIPRRAVSTEDIERVRLAAHEAVGSDVHFHIDVVDQLIQEKSGKFKLVHSLVPHPANP
jgi:phenylacetate-CoA ligase